MRFSLFLLMFVASFSTLNSQNGYVFSKFERAYAPLSDADTISPTNWEDVGINISLMTEVELFGRIMAEPIIFAGGALGFENVDSLFVISPFFGDLSSSQLDTTMHLSPILIEETSGSGPLFTTEWRNAHFSILSGLSDFINFQLKYYEDGTIEFCYGPSAVDLARKEYIDRGDIFGGLVGIGGGPDDSLTIGLFLEGEVGQEIIAKDQLEELSGFPGTNMVYQFKAQPNSTSNGQYKEDCFRYIHNTAERSIFFPKIDSAVKCVSINGQTLQTFVGKGPHSLSHLPEGIFFLQSAECLSSAKIFHRR